TLDISNKTNLAVSATGLTLSGDTIALTAGYEIPLTASTTEWADAYAWGDHSLAGYLTTESDPIFLASDAAGITAGDIITWNSTASSTDLLIASSTNWDTAYTWGDHSLAGYLTATNNL